MKAQIHLVYGVVVIVIVIVVFFGLINYLSTSNKKHIAVSAEEVLVVKTENIANAIDTIASLPNCYDIEGGPPQSCLEDKDRVLLLEKLTNIVIEPYEKEAKE